MIIVCALLAFVGGTVQPAYAEGISIISDDIDWKGDCDINTGSFEAECIPAFLAHVIKQIFAFSGGIFLIMTLIGGLQFTIPFQSVGGKEKAMGTLRLGIIGMIVSGLSFFILQFIVNALAGG